MSAYIYRVMANGKNHDAECYERAARIRDALAERGAPKIRVYKVPSDPSYGGCLNPSWELWELSFDAPGSFDRTPFRRIV